jgi:hypothetical protein
MVLNTKTHPFAAFHIRNVRFYINWAIKTAIRNTISNFLLHIFEFSENWNFHIIKSNTSSSAVYSLCGDKQSNGNHKPIWIRRGFRSWVNELRLFFNSFTFNYTFASNARMTEKPTHSDYMQSEFAHDYRKPSTTELTNTEFTTAVTWTVIEASEYISGRYILIFYNPFLYNPPQKPESPKCFCLQARRLNFVHYTDVPPYSLNQYPRFTAIRKKKGKLNK